MIDFMKSSELHQWQQDLRTEPKVWSVLIWFEGTCESTGNLYATKDGAEMEAAYWRKRKRKAEVVGDNVHSDELSKRRWAE